MELFIIYAGLVTREHKDLALSTFQTSKELVTVDTNAITVSNFNRSFFLMEWWHRCLDQWKEEGMMFFFWINQDWMNTCSCCHLMHMFTVIRLIHWDLGSLLLSKAPVKPIPQRAWNSNMRTVRISMEHGFMVVTTLGTHALLSLSEPNCSTFWTSTSLAWWIF